MHRQFFVALLTAAWGVSASAAPFAYVPDRVNSPGTSTVNVIDAATDAVVATIPVGTFSTGVAVSSDGLTVYVTNYSDDTISVIDALTNTVVGTIGGLYNPFALVISHDGSTLYVIGGGYSGPVQVVDTATSTVVAEIFDPVFGSFNGPILGVLTPDGSKLYVTNVSGTRSVSVIDTASNTVVAALTGAGCRQIDVHPDGSKVYAAENCTYPNGVSVIDTATDTLITKIPLSSPFNVRVHPDGTRVYVSSSAALSVIDVATNTVSASTPTGFTTFGLDINPAGTKVYATDISNPQVHVYDADTLALLTAIPVTDRAEANGHFIGPELICGNGILEPGEQCDDGNTESLDGCSGTCEKEPLDHLKCYKAKDLRSPKFVTTTVDLTDQFGVNDGQFEVKKPFLLCNPADKNGEGITDPSDHLTCYKVKGRKLDKVERPQVEVTDQFGTLQLEAKKPFLLCVPSAKTVLP